MKQCLSDAQVMALVNGEANGDRELHSDWELHAGSCGQCRRRVSDLCDGVSELETSARLLAEETPGSLEGRLRWQLKSGATTLREPAAQRGWLPTWLAEHRALAFGSAAAGVLVTLAFGLAGPTSTVSAAQILERSYKAVFQTLEGAQAQRISYRVRYDGPRFGVLPDDTSDFVLEELWDRSEPAGLKLALSTHDGTLVRGFTQMGMTRRIVARTPEGVLDMTFHLAQPMKDQARLDERRRQLAQTAFRALTGVADATRLSVIERDGNHVVELGPAVDSSSLLADGVIEIDRARVVIDATTFRVASAMLSGRLLGEAFALQADVVMVESLRSGELVAADFDLPKVAGAVELVADGTSLPLADVARVILREALRDQPTTR